MLIKSLQSTHIFLKMLCIDYDSTPRKRLNTQLIFFRSLFSVDALKCWRCSSDSATSAFCDDTFDPSIIDETVWEIYFIVEYLKKLFNSQKRRWAYVDCNYPQNPYGQNQQPFGFGQNSNNRPVCKKMKQLSEYLFFPWHTQLRKTPIDLRNNHLQFYFDFHSLNELKNFFMIFTFCQT